MTSHHFPSGEAIALPKTIVLVGLMGAGKSAVGRRLAGKLGVPFRDADTEIENAAGCSIEEIFARDGEAVFRQGERRVIARLLTAEPIHILATGGGAYMDASTRDLIAKAGVSVWLNANLDILVARTARRNHRPLLKNSNPREVLQRLIDLRYPTYAEAAVTVISDERPPDATVEAVIDALEDYFGAPLKRGTRSSHDGDTNA